MRSSARWCGQGSLDRPPVGQSPSQPERVDLESFSPYRDRESLAAKLQESVTSRIVHLLSPRRPPAVVWSVGTTVVDAVQRISGRPRPHIGEECLERVTPSLTDDDATATIIRIDSALGIRAAVIHRAPDHRFCGSGSSVSAVQISDLLVSDATTANLSARSKIASRHDRRLATTALADPFPRVASSGRQSDDIQTAKYLTTQIDDLVAHSRSISPAQPSFIRRSEC